MKSDKSISSGTTIAALATAPMPAGVGIVRVSGPLAVKAIEQVCDFGPSVLAAPRSLVFGNFRDATTGKKIDTGMVAYFPAPKSFTGEDCVEFHIHGSPLISKEIIQSVCSIGIEHAKPGEFSERAFLNGKMDLVQAEAVSDLIHASSSRALELAQSQFEGQLSTAINKIAEPLRDGLAELEAHLDFPEEDIDPASLEELNQNLHNVSGTLGSLLATYAFGQQVKEGLHVVLFGKPNVGKSSLLNALLEKDRAIVTDVSGTTRDELEEALAIGEYRVVLCDTAGITETADLVEQIGIARSQKRLQWADLVFLIVDAQDKPEDWKNQLSTVRESNKNVWLLVNKTDLEFAQASTLTLESGKCFSISAKTGAGLDDLRNSLVAEIESLSAANSSGAATITSERHQHCLLKAQQAVKQAQQVLGDGLSLEFISAEIRIALSSLEELVGKTYTEDILGRIFSKFCIGK